jgi:hypothetical protein
VHLAEKECDQKRSDMCAVDIGVGHDNDFLVTKVLLAIARARAAAERLDEIAQELVVGELG